MIDPALYKFHQQAMAAERRAERADQILLWVAFVLAFVAGAAFGYLVRI